MNNDTGFLRSSSSRSALMMIFAALTRYALMHQRVEIPRIPRHCSASAGVHPFVQRRRRKFKGWQRQQRERARKGR